MPPPIVDFKTIRVLDWVWCFDVTGHVKEIETDSTGMMWITVQHKAGEFSLCEDEVDSIEHYQPNAGSVEDAIAELIDL